MFARHSVNDAVASGAVADTVQRVAVLLGAGLAPDRSWSYVGQVDAGAAATISARVDQGLPMSEAIAAEGASWQPVATAWRVATVSGAPLAEALRAIASAVRDGAEVAQDVRVALAEPMMTARIMLWLPVFGLALGGALGFDTFGTVTQNPIALGCVTAGAFLVLAARLWSARLVRRAVDADPAPGLYAELLAVALSGGVSISRARELVGDASGAASDMEDAARVLELSRLAGVPAAELLRTASADARVRARVTARLRAARLSTALLLPLGICTLPAFFLLGVAPMVLSVMASSRLGF